MSSFTKPLNVQILREGKGGRVRAAVLTPFEFYSDHGDTVVVPSDFVTDFASTPRAFWSVAPPFGPWAKAAVIHDYLYLTQPCDRYTADQMFLEGMRVLGVSEPYAVGIWTMVRIFGSRTWKEHTK